MLLSPLRARRRRTPDESDAGLPRSAASAERALDLSAVTQRIAGLIDGPVSDALVALLTDLYGNALTRILGTIRDAPAGSQILDRLYDDRLVGGLLVVHDLHPRTLPARVERALAGVCASTPQHVRIELDRIEDDVVYVRLAAPAGPAARTAIAHAIAAAAPEIAGVCAEVDAVEDRTLHF
jgi:hypothetical protein